MQDLFDELAKGLAGGISRREAFRRFGLGIVGVLMASLGLENAVACPGRAASPC